jgi:hypothetical protein
MNIFVKAKVRYWEDGLISKDGKNYVEDVIKEMPCIDGVDWSPIIENETGIIQNWEKGIFAKLHYKVCDQCTIALDAPENTIQESDYVPSWLSIEDNGYGDYIIINIDGDGKINNWKPIKVTK